MTSHSMGITKALIGSLVILGALRADASAILSSPGTGTGSGDGYTVGYSFTVGNENLLVSSLGYYDLGGDGLDGSHAVGIWSSSGTLLATAMVDSGTTDPLVDGFRYSPTPIALVLLPDTTYVIGAEAGSSSMGTYDVFGDTNIGGTNTITYSPDANTYRQLYSQGTSLTFPSTPNGLDSNSGQNVYYAPNFQYTTVPEPASMGLAALGSMVLLVRRRAMWR